MLDVSAGSWVEISAVLTCGYGQGAFASEVGYFYKPTREKGAWDTDDTQNDLLHEQMN